MKSVERWSFMESQWKVKKTNGGGGTVDGFAGRK